MTTPRQKSQVVRYPMLLLSAFRGMSVCMWSGSLAKHTTWTDNADNAGGKNEMTDTLLTL